MSSVIVLLSAYNGEKHLAAQLKSLVAQTYEDVKVLVHDDGSTDGTCAIIDLFIKKYPGRIEKAPSYGTHLGYPDCFWRLLADAPRADYYAFCDQDDLWSKDKIARAVKVMDAEPESEKLLYIHDYLMYDEVSGAKAVHRMEEQGAPDAYGIVFYVKAQGMSMLINGSMRDHLNGQELTGKDASHDQWCIWTAYFAGRICTDKSILAKHIRHRDTATPGDITVSGKLRTLIRKEIFGDEFSALCARMTRFTLINKDMMPEDVREDWLLLAGRKRGISSYIKRVMFPSRMRPSYGGELALRLMLLMGKR